MLCRPCFVKILFFLCLKAHKKAFSISSYICGHVVHLALETLTTPTFLYFVIVYIKLVKYLLSSLLSLSFMKIHIAHFKMIQKCFHRKGFWQLSSKIIHKYYFCSCKIVLHLPWCPPNISFFYVNSKLVVCAHESLSVIVFPSFVKCVPWFRLNCNILIVFVFHTPWDTTKLDDRT